MSEPTKHYELTIDVRSDLRRRPPSMGEVVDAVADWLEREGFTDRDYSVEVRSDPELRIAVVAR